MWLFSKTKKFDVALITDIGFPGGSGSSSAQEIRLQHEGGLRTALFHAPSTRMGRYPGRRKRYGRPSPKIQACLSGGCAALLSRSAKAHAPITIIRHPTVANFSEFLPQNLSTDRVIVVINHPAVKPDGTVDYELASIVSNIESVFHITPKLCPISPVVANACRGPESQSVALNDFWHNVFDVPENISRPRSPDAPIVVGRHSRDNWEKWPEDPDILRAVYPLTDGIEIKVMGGAEIPKSILGALPPNWDVLPFDPFGKDTFLRAIDVYVYFHHSKWVEAFGRSPGEAIIAGIPTILPPYLRATFGDAALYCEPSEVLDVVRQLQKSPDWYAEVSSRGRRLAIQKFGAPHHLERLRGGAEVTAR